MNAGLEHFVDLSEEKQRDSINGFRFFSLDEVADLILSIQHVWGRLGTVWDGFGTGALLRITRGYAAWDGGTAVYPQEGGTPRGGPLLSSVSCLRI